MFNLLVIQTVAKNYNLVCMVVHRYMYWDVCIAIRSWYTVLIDIKFLRTPKYFGVFYCPKKQICLLTVRLLVRLSWRSFLQSYNVKWSRIVKDQSINSITCNKRATVAYSWLLFINLLYYANIMPKHSFIMLNGGG